jgi:CP family cyanate transporter-like MFS transporter
MRGLPAASGSSPAPLLAGASIGIIGVLLPGIVKREFPDKADIMTGVYTMALCLGAALAAGATVPLARAADSWSHWLFPFGHFLPCIGGPCLANTHTMRAHARCE